MPITDDFSSQVAGTLLSADPNWELLYDGGAGSQSGEIEYISGGQIEVTVYGYDSGDQHTIWGRTDGPFPDDQFAELRYVNDDSTRFTGVRFNSSGDGYYAQYGGGVSRIWRLDAGVATLLVNFFPTTAADVVVRIEATGTTIRLLEDGVERHSITDATHSSGVPGIDHVQGTGGQSDDFECSDPVASGPPSGTATLVAEATVSGGGSSPAIPPATGTSSVPVAVVVSASGSAPPVPVNTGTTSIASDTLVSASGSAPPVPVNTGTTSIASDTLVSASGSAPPVPVNTGTTSIAVNALVSATGTAPAVAVQSGAASLAADAAVSVTGSAPAVPVNSGTVPIAAGATVTANGSAPAPGISDGTVSLGATSAVSATGSAPAVPTNTGTVSLAADAAVSAAGSAPSIGVAEGTVVIDARVDVNAAGATARTGITAIPARAVLTATGINGEGPTIGIQVFDGANLRAVTSIEVHDGAALQAGLLAVGP